MVNPDALNQVQHKGNNNRQGRRRITSHPLFHLLVALLLLGLTQTFLVKQFAVPSGSMEHTLEIGDRVLVNRLGYSALGSSQEPQLGDIIVFSTDDSLWPRESNDSENQVLNLIKQSFKFVVGDLIGIGPTSKPMLIKRVIGTPGDTVNCCDAEGQVVINGQPQTEPYIFEDPTFVPGDIDCDTAQVSRRCFPEVMVPEGMLLVLGDHRGSSADGIAHCRGLAINTDTNQCAQWVRINDVVGKAELRIWPLSRFGSLH